MTDIWFGVSTAIWLGLVTAVSPCPLASNLAATAYIGRQVNSPLRSLWSGVAYGAGRVLAYTVLGVVIAGSLATASTASNWLQDVFMKAFGPILILVGMTLTDLLSFPLPQGFRTDRWQERAGSFHLFGALMLGFLSALAFCPVSAALYFGSLIPLSLESSHYVLFPVIFGIATALPVVILGAGLAMGARWAGSALRQLPRFERVARYATGVIFILAGLYLSAKYIFHLI